MSYCKKTIILKSKENHITTPKMLTLEADVNKTKLNLKQMEMFKDGEIICYIAINNNFSKPIHIKATGLGEIEFYLNTPLTLNDNVIAIFVCPKNSNSKLLLFGTCGDYDSKILNKIITKIENGEDLEKEFKETKQQEQFAENNKNKAIIENSKNKESSRILEINRNKENSKILNMPTKKTMSQEQEIRKDDEIEEEYYKLIKEQLDEMFITYPKVHIVSNLFKNSEFVKVDYLQDNSYYLLGVVSENKKIVKIVYAVATKNEIEVPVDIKDSCKFIKLEDFSIEGFDDEEIVGFFVMVQNAQNGEIDTL